MPGSVASRAADTSSSVRVRSANKKNFRLTDKEIAVLLQISPEPRLRWDSVVSVSIDKAIDDNDQKLSAVMAANPAGVGGGLILPGRAAGGVLIIGGAGGAGGIWMPPSSNGLMHHVPVRLQKGEKESKSLKELTGTIAAQVMGDAEQMVVVDTPMKAVGKSFKGKESGEMKILSAGKQEDGSLQICFEFEFPEGTIAKRRFSYRGAHDPSRCGGAGDGKGPPPIVPAPALPPPVGPGGLAMIGGMSVPRFAFNGLTLRDEKGNVLTAMISFNFKKGGGFLAGRRMEYIATYRPTDKDAAEPAKLVYTGRRRLSVNIPFALKNVELK